MLVVLFAVACAAISTTLVSSFWAEEADISLWGQKSMASFLFAYSAVLGFVLGWFATRLTRAAIRKGKAQPLHWHLKSQTLIDRLPDRTFSRAFMFSLAGCVIAALLVLLLHQIKLQYISVSEGLVLNVIYSMLFAAAITIMGVYRALGDNNMSRTRA
ncbi:hypothetical protein FJM65_00585 [Pontibacter mangrovi]|uniref:Uncharacterized protein n=2 Tax=Pontibacter mangrovi TaxID=2589816 RepID=A0A501WJR5_9BACT|nr:hypothetical protein FJM65_00585 [Pontibacter mangrovi]